MGHVILVGMIVVGMLIIMVLPARIGMRLADSESQAQSQAEQDR